MGVSQINNAKPKRLYRRDAQWVLEVERLMPWADRILRPTMQKLVGEEVVLFQLGSSEDGRALASEARRLMNESGDEATSYAVVDGRWVPAAFASQVEPPPPESRPRPQRPAALAASSLEIYMLRDDLRSLRAAHDKLVARVAELERGVIAPMPLPIASAPKVPSQHAPAPVAVVDEMDVSDVADDAPVEPTLQLPALDALAAQVVAMTGERAAMTAAKKPLDLDSRELFVCWITDDADATVGAMIANLEAVVTKGAKLMLLPDHEIAAQLKSRVPTEEVTAAMGEIFNVIASAFNAMPESVHVRTQPIEALSAADHAWLRAPKSRVDLGDAQGCLMTFAIKPEEDK